MRKEEFYKECDQLFKQSHPPPTTSKYRRRWGPRSPGSGRFEGYGIVRWFSPTTVHIAIRVPVPIRVTVTAAEALKLIAAIITAV